MKICPNDEYYFWSKSMDQKANEKFQNLKWDIVIWR
jgi:hypothetical protein